MAAIDRHDIMTKVVAALRADGTVTGLLGASPNTRIGHHVERGWAFPFTRIDYIATAHLTGVKGTSGGGDWARQLGLQFTTFDQSTSLAVVCDCQKAIIDVMDDPTNIVLTTGTCFMSTPGAEFADYDEENGTSFSVCEFTLAIDSD